LLPVTVALICTTPYCVWIASPTIVRLAALELGFGGALVDWLARLEERPAIAAEAGIVAAL